MPFQQLHPALRLSSLSCRSSGFLLSDMPEKESLLSGILGFPFTNQASDVNLINSSSASVGVTKVLLLTSRNYCIVLLMQFLLPVRCAVLFCLNVSEPTCPVYGFLKGAIQDCFCKIIIMWQAGPLCAFIRYRSVDMDSTPGSQVLMD